MGNYGNGPRGADLTGDGSHLKVAERYRDFLNLILSDNPCIDLVNGQDLSSIEKLEDDETIGSSMHL